MDVKKDCWTCKHKQVCKYVQHFQTLIQLGTVEFNCNLYMGSQENSKKQNTAKPVVKDEHPEMTLSELSHMVNKDYEEDEKPDSHSGTCAICGKESSKVFTCSDCGRAVIENCGELTNMLDPFTGKTSTGFVCKECDD